MPSAPITTGACACSPAAALRVTADARHRPVGRQDLVDREALAQLRARLDRRVDQQLVEDGAARAVRARRPRRSAAASRRSSPARSRTSRSRPAGTRSPRAAPAGPSARARPRPADARGGWTSCRSGTSPCRPAAPGSPCGRAASRSASPRSALRRRSRHTSRRSCRTTSLRSRRPSHDARDGASAPYVSAGCIVLPCGRRVGVRPRGRPTRFPTLRPDARSSRPHQPGAAIDAAPARRKSSCSCATQRSTPHVSAAPA